MQGDALAQAHLLADGEHEDHHRGRVEPYHVTVMYIMLYHIIVWSTILCYDTVN